jgi:hypothetical protein
LHITRLPAAIEMAHAALVLGLSGLRRAGLGFGLATAAYLPLFELRE